MLATLDYVFPFYVFFYGALITFVLHQPQLQRLAQERFPAELRQQMESHRALALLCLLVGGLWSLQNLWLGPTGH
jgi:hypothetical protein